MGRAVLLFAAARFLHAQIYADNLPLEHPAIRYFEDAPRDPVALLQKTLVQDDLAGLLRQLGINADSQALVFSKTSFQATKISPRNPRAIYFNDEIAVGYVRGGEGIEIASLDPRQGVIFYFLKGSSLERKQECLHCHQGPSTSGVPGIFIGSVYPGPTGAPSRNAAIITDHRTPFADRWGGWYVNAAAGQQPDRSNAIAPDPAEPHTLEAFTKPFNGAGYLSPVSDIVALMTFEHQTQAVNLITRLAWHSRLQSADVDADIEGLVRYMIFTGEAPIKEPIRGVSTFTETFPLRGPKDRQGRSLRDFDLKTRLFRYPLSYMIYSPAFDALPEAIRVRIYKRIEATLPKERRGEILEILRETKPDFAQLAL
jgi:hypothetical protein